MKLIQFRSRAENFEIQFWVLVDGPTHSRDININMAVIRSITAFCGFDFERIIRWFSTLILGPSNYSAKILLKVNRKRPLITCVWKLFLKLHDFGYLKHQRIMVFMCLYTRNNAPVHYWQNIALCRVRSKSVKKYACCICSQYQTYEFKLVDFEGFWLNQ